MRVWACLIPPTSVSNADLPRLTEVTTLPPSLPKAPSSTQVYQLPFSSFSLISIIDYSSNSFFLGL